MSLSLKPVNLAIALLFLSTKADRFILSPTNSINHPKMAWSLLLNSRPYANYEITHANKPILLTGAHNLVITGNTITGGAVPDIILRDCHHIKIMRNRLLNSVGPGITLYNCHHITIEDNYFTNVSTGVYAERSEGGNIIVRNNQFLNMRGPYPRGQCVQYNNINGAGNEISYNKCENILGHSNPEDIISLYKSNGSAGHPIMVKNNWIRGGGPSKSGGGIMLGDNGGSYQLALGNILVNPGQYGIAISGGDHNAIVGNSIYAHAQHFTNVGIYVAGYNGSICTNSTVKNNRVNYFNKLQQANPCWIGPNASAPAGWDANIWKAPLSAHILPNKIIQN